MAKSIICLWAIVGIQIRGAAAVTARCKGSCSYCPLQRQLQLLPAAKATAVTARCKGGSKGNSEYSNAKNSRLSAIRPINIYCISNLIYNIYIIKKIDIDFIKAQLYSSIMILVISAEEAKAQR